MRTMNGNTHLSLPKIMVVLRQLFRFGLKQRCGRSAGGTRHERMIDSRHKTLLDGSDYHVETQRHLGLSTSPISGLFALRVR
jgi:hypothetical protein